MNLPDAYVDLNSWIVSFAGDGHTVAHVHAGLAIYVLVQLVTRDRRASIQGLICVAGAELANEILEAAHYGSMRWADTLSDIATTLFWPTALHLVSRYRRQRWAKRALAHSLMAARTAELTTSAAR